MTTTKNRPLKLKSNSTLLPKQNRAKAFAPATSANLATGFDLLGISFDLIGDVVTVEVIDEPTVKVASVTGLLTELPVDPQKNTATAGLLHLIRDYQLPFGFSLSIEKGIPLGSGMGGSAASAVAALVAANSLLSSSLPNDRLLHYALISEAIAGVVEPNQFWAQEHMISSSHPDNVVPCLLGGLTLSTIVPEQIDSDGSKNKSKLHAISLPIPKDLYLVLVHPHLKIITQEARAILSSQVPMHLHTQQSALLALFINGCYLNRLDLIQDSLRDLIVEPQRSRLIPGFHQAQQVAMENGAFGCSISGSGPTLFALTNQPLAAEKIKLEMQGQFAEMDIDSEGWVAALPCRGAHVLEI